MKKVKYLFLIFILIVSLSACSISKEELTGDMFIKELEKQEYKVYNATDEYKDYCKEYYMTFKDNIQIELGIFEEEEEAIAFLKAIIDDAKDNKSDSDEINEKENEKFTKKSSDEYLEVARYQKTVLYISTIPDKQKAADKIFEKFNY